MKKFVVRNGERYPRTIDYRCHRCLCVQPSRPMPTDPKQLGIYDLPAGWELVVTPLGQDDLSRCAECVKDIRRGSPVELGR